MIGQSARSPLGSTQFAANSQVTLNVTFDSPLISATVVRRYKRFLVDLNLENGEPVTAHCPNTGSMASCWEDGWPAMLSKSDNPKRKYAYTWEMTHNGNCWIGINTQNPNRLAFEVITAGHIPELTGIDDLKREYKYSEKTRFDLHGVRGGKDVFIEIKNVTLKEGDAYMFPDAVTKRGLKHLNELTDIRNSGNEAVMLYIIQRTDAGVFMPAEDIDPTYASALRSAADAGVTVLAYDVNVTPKSLILGNPVPIQL
jgi:sugar fermentation stimulation protein A